MNIALIGSGGREHALCQKIYESPLSKNIICIPGNAGISKIARCFKVDLNKKTTFNLLGNFYSFSTVKQKEAWNMPNYDVSIIAKTHIGNKIYMTGSYFITGNREAINLEEIQQTLDVINDINEIKLVSRRANQLTYSSKTDSNQFAVFSEAFYKNGWQAYIDNKPVNHYKVNYLLSD